MNEARALPDPRGNYQIKDTNFLLFKIIMQKGDINSFHIPRCYQSVDSVGDSVTNIRFIMFIDISNTILLHTPCR